MSKICPFISTAQIIPMSLAFIGQSQQEPGIKIQGMASTKPTAQIQAQGAFDYKASAPPGLQEAVKEKKISPEEAQKQLKPVAESLSVPCLQDKCQLWSEVHGDCRIGIQAVSV